MIKKYPNNTNTSRLACYIKDTSNLVFLSTDGTNGTSIDIAKVKIETDTLDKLPTHDETSFLFDGIKVKSDKKVLYINHNGPKLNGVYTIEKIYQTQEILDKNIEIAKHTFKQKKIKDRLSMQGKSIYGPSKRK